MCQKKEKYVNRDILMANSVKKMSELGLFDEEFSCYGITFYENNEQKYYLSTHEKNVYDNFFLKLERNQFPLLPVSEQRFYPNASGLSRCINLDIKKILAQKMHMIFRNDWYLNFISFAASIRDNLAEPILENLKKAIIGKFIEEDLILFEQMITRAYNAKHLTTEVFIQLKQWVKSEIMQLDSINISKDKFQKTLFAFSYINDDGKIMNFFNAEPTNVYKKMINLRINGYLCSDVISKTYHYNYLYSLRDVRNDFSKFISNLLDDKYFRFLMQLQELRPTISLEEYKRNLQQFERCDPVFTHSILFYGNLWGINIRM